MRRIALINPIQGDAIALAKLVGNFKRDAPVPKLVLVPSVGLAFDLAAQIGLRKLQCLAKIAKSFTDDLRAVDHARMVRCGRAVVYFQCVTQDSPLTHSHNVNMMPVMLTTIDQIIDALGGTAKAAAAAHVGASAVSNWKARGTIPADRYFLINGALKAAGHPEADPTVFGMATPADAAE